VVRGEWRVHLDASTPAPSKELTSPIRFATACFRSATKESEKFHVRFALVPMAPMRISVDFRLYVYSLKKTPNSYSKSEFMIYCITANLIYLCFEFEIDGFII
jgi:hypothetical protein